MDLTQKDFDERVNRVAAGNGTDEDARLVQHYQDNGFVPGGGHGDATAPTGFEATGTAEVIPGDEPAGKSADDKPRGSRGKQA